MRIGIVTFPGVDELDFFGVHGILSKLDASHGQSLPYTLSCISHSDSVETAAGFAVNPALLEKPEGAYDAVIIPGGRAATDLADTGAYDDFIKAQVAFGARIYTVCSGVFLLKNTGLLNDIRFSCHANKRRLFPGHYAANIQQGLVRHDWLTSIGGAPSASVKSVDIAFQVIRDFFPEQFDAVSKRTEISPDRALVDMAGAMAFSP